MPDNKLEIVIEAVDNVSKKLDAIQNNIEKTGVKTKKSLLDVGAAIFIAEKAFNILKSGVEQVVEAASQQEEAIKRLNFALKNQGTFTEELSASYQKMAGSLQNSTRFADDAIEELMQQLVSVGNVAPAQMERVVKATLDFATATGTDLGSAQDIMAKAAAGNTAALGRYGIVLDEAIPKSQRFGEALRFIEQRFGGAAVNDVDSFSGSLAQLKNNWDEFLETLGNFVIKSAAAKSAIESISYALQYYKNILDGASQKEREYSTEQTRFMSGQVEEINKKIKALETNYRISGGQAEKERQINDLLIERQRIVDTIQRLEKNEKSNNDIKNSLIQAQNASEETKKKLRADAEEIERGFKEAADRLNDIGMLFKSGAISSQEYYAAIIASQDQVQFRNTLEMDQLSQIANLRRQIGDSQLMDDQRRNQEQIALLQEYQTNYNVAHQGMAAFTKTVSSAIRTDLSGALTSIITGAKSAKEAFADFGRQMIAVIVQFMVQKLVASVLEKTLLAASVKEAQIAGAQIAAAYAPAALAANIATFGGAGIAAAATSGLAGAALGTAMGAVAAFGKVGGAVNARATGGDDVVTKPTLFLAGENGPERATFTPLNGRGGSGGGIGGDINIHIYEPRFNSESDVRNLTEQIGFELERELRNARSIV